MDYRMRNACRDGDIEYIVKEMKNNRNYQNMHLDYPHPLFFSASGGKIESIKFIIKNHGCTKENVIDAIYISSISGHYDCVEYLFSLLKEFDITHSRLIYAFNKCIIKKYKKIIKLFLEKNVYYENENVNCFLTCVKENDLETLECIMDKYTNYDRFIPKALEIGFQNSNKKIINIFSDISF